MLVVITANLADLIVVVVAAAAAVLLLTVVSRSFKSLLFRVALLWR